MLINVNCVADVMRHSLDFLAVLKSLVQRSSAQIVVQISYLLIYQR